MGGKGQALHYRNRQTHPRKGAWTNAYGNRIQVTQRHSFLLQ
jgi:hypothetical protein